MPRFEISFLESPYLLYKYEKLGGEGYNFKAELPYLLSVVRFYGTYGYENGLFELAIVLPNKKVCEPIGHLSVYDVLDILDYENGKDLDNEIIRKWKESKEDDEVEQRLRLIMKEMKEYDTKYQSLA